MCTCKCISISFNLSRPKSPVGGRGGLPIPPHRLPHWSTTQQLGPNLLIRLATSLSLADHLGSSSVRNDNDAILVRHDPVARPDEGDVFCVPRGDGERNVHLDHPAFTACACRSVAVGPHLPSASCIALGWEGRGGRDIREIPTRDVLPDRVFCLR